jgi:hypothetical protein
MTFNAHFDELWVEREPAAAETAQRQEWTADGPPACGKAA